MEKWIPKQMKCTRLRANFNLQSNNIDAIDNTRYWFGHRGCNRDWRPRWSRWNLRWKLWVSSRGCAFATRNCQTDINPSANLYFRCVDGARWSVTAPKLTLHQRFNISYQPAFSSRVNCLFSKSSCHFRPPVSIGLFSAICEAAEFITGSSRFCAVANVDDEGSISIPFSP